MFLMHVDEENSEYPVSAEHTVLTKHKKNDLFSNIAAATQRTNNLDV